MKNQKTVYLGSLGPMEYFRLPGSQVDYRTISYPPMNTNPSNGTRWCMNMANLKAEWKFCRSRVVPRGT